MPRPHFIIFEFIIKYWRLLYVFHSSVRIIDAPIPATCLRGNVESVIEVETVYWVAQAFYKPVSDRKSYKEQCGPTEGTECNNMQAIHTQLSSYYPRKEEKKRHLLCSTMLKTKTIISSLFCPYQQHNSCSMKCYHVFSTDINTYTCK